MMNYFLVYQNKTYDLEKNGKYLWAPTLAKNNRTIIFWDNMKEIKNGDIIFNCCKQKIVSFMIATTEYQIAPNPFNESPWEKIGYLVKGDYHELKKPLKLNEYRETIIELRDNKYSPFTKDGKGVQGYLFKLNHKLRDFFLDILSEEIKNDPNIAKLSNDYTKQFIEETEEEIKNLKPTEKDAIVKIRLNQGEYRRKLLELDPKCKICGLNKKELLIASHSKPWSKSTQEEKLDKYNGFLFCPSHDALYDKGFISFNDDGTIIISDELDEETKNLLNIDYSIKISLDEKHKKYLTYHREIIFRNVINYKRG